MAKEWISFVYESFSFYSESTVLFPLKCQSFPLGSLDEDLLIHEEYFTFKQQTIVTSTDALYAIVYLSESGRQALAKEILETIIVYIECIIYIVCMYCLYTLFISLVRLWYKTPLCHPEAACFPFQYFKKITKLEKLFIFSSLNPNMQNWWA